MNTDFQFKFKFIFTGSEFPGPLTFEQRCRRQAFIFLKLSDIFKDGA